MTETTARRIKLEYLQKLKNMHASEDVADPVVKSLPTKPQERPLLLGLELNQAVQSYITALRAVGGVVNTSIVMAAAEGVVPARDASLLKEHGRYIQITKTWAKSLLKRLGYVKWKCSNARKVNVAHFEEVREAFLADITAEAVINDIPNEMIFNWDQIALHYVPTGEWTMHRAEETVIPIANSDDKRQITGVFAATLSGEYLPPQFIYKGKTEC